MANRKGLLIGSGQTGQRESDFEYLAGTGRVWNEGYGTGHRSKKVPVLEDK